MSESITKEECLAVLDITEKQWGHSRTGPVALDLIDRYDIKSFVEVGSQTSYLSELIAVTHPNVMIYCIDLSFHRPELSQKYDNISLIKGDATESADRFGEKSIDMVYVDALHTYEAVKKDLAAWYPNTKKIFSGHDYGHGNFPGCTQAVDEFFSTHPELKFNVEDYYNFWAEINE